jgi:hypothetical protein
MPDIKPLIRSVVDYRVRDSVWAFRTRGDLTVLSAVARGVLGIRYPDGKNSDHIKAAMNWLCAAQDAGDGSGVSAFFDIRSGEWGPLYPETTGYIIPTFYNFAISMGDESYRIRAERMLDWLLTLQLNEGGFPIGPLWPDWERAPIIFDTGQVLHGLVRAYEETGRSDAFDAARRAGDWLVQVQDPDGSWRKFTSLGIVHTYNVRTAWALLRLYQICPSSIYQAGAIKNIDWAIAQQKRDGWFDHNGFRTGENPLTHTIAYTIEGLLESAVLLSDDRIFQSARIAADALLQVKKEDGFLHARYGEGWKSSLTWSCLTGVSQIALIWLRLYEITGEKHYFEAAQLSNRYVKQTQNRGSKIPDVSGGIAGSFPIFSEYEPYRYLNWAAKFFVDSLLLEECLCGKQSSQKISF